MNNMELINFNQLFDYFNNIYTNFPAAKNNIKGILGQLFTQENFEEAWFAIAINFAKQKNYEKLQIFINFEEELNITYNFEHEFTENCILRNDLETLQFLHTINYLSSSSSHIKSTASLNIVKFLIEVFGKENYKNEIEKIEINPIHNYLKSL